MSEIQQAQQAIERFLTQKIATTIEQKKKKDKDKFTENDEAKIRQSYEPYTWINKAVENVDKIFLNVSHVAKLTHSSSQATSLKDNITQTDYLHLITTQTAKANILDSGYANASLAPIAEFLSFPIENSHQQLGELLSKHEQCFARISDDINERQAWCQAIQEVYISKKISSHTLAKQIYLPVADGYHLLSPMYSSALAQHLYLAIRNAHDKDNPAKVAKRQNTWHEEETIYFPKVATLGITKSNHQNVSMLNGQRSGQLYLFSAIPPKIKRNPKPPYTIKDLLAYCYKYCQNNLLDIKLLLHVTDNKKLFLNHSRKKILITHIQTITEYIIDTMATIRQENPKGWTNSFNTPMCLKLFLDKEILDEQQFSQPQIMTYIDELALEIAQWINRHIGHSGRLDLEKIWVKIIIYIIHNYYTLLKAE